LLLQGQLRNNNARSLPHGVAGDMRGNPRFASSCLRPVVLPGVEEKEIQVIIDVLCGDTLIMDDMDSAYEYRRYLSERNRPCPTILALREMRALSRQNIEDTRPGQTAGPYEHMNARIGVRNVDAMRVSQSTERLVTTLRRMIDLDRQRAQLQDSIRRTDEQKREATQQLLQATQTAQLEGMSVIPAGNIRGAPAAAAAAATPTSSGSRRTRETNGAATPAGVPPLESVVPSPKRQRR